MNIRRAGAEDAKVISRFIAMAESEMLPLLTGTHDKDQSAALLIRYIEHFPLNRYSLANNLVIEADGRVAGSIISFPADKQPELDRAILEELQHRDIPAPILIQEGVPGTYYLSTMGVDPAFRGRGLGSALLDAAMQLGREQDFKQASLLVSTEKPRAKSLYERIGFYEKEPLEMNGHPYFRMVKDL